MRYARWRRFAGAVLFLTVTCGAWAALLGASPLGVGTAPLETAPLETARAPVPPPPHALAAPGGQEGQPRRGPPPAAGPRLAVVIDDVGWGSPAVDAMMALPWPITFAIMPSGPRAADYAASAAALGHQVLVHLPMQPADASQYPGPGAVAPGMAGRAIDRLVAGHLSRVPGAAGANNHMGSLATADLPAMRATLYALRERGLFFLDSATTAASASRAAAAAVGAPLVVNDLFIDNVREVEATSARLRDLVRLAQRRGWAVGIGHPCLTTAAALAAVLPELAAAGVEVVPVGDLAR